MSTDQQALNEMARAVAEVFGPVFARTTPDEWNRLVAEDRIVYDDDGRAVRVKPEEGKE